MLEQLIHKAQRRLLLNEALRQFAVAAALAIAALALLLTVGTRYLQWWIVAIFALVAVGWAYTRLRRHWPSDYSAALWLDNKAGLHDALSTAHHFLKMRSVATTPETEAFLHAQRDQAESAANDVDIKSTVPFRVPRAIYGAAALLALSAGLIGVRYFYRHSLDLSAPLTQVVFQDQENGSQPVQLGRTQPEEKKSLQQARDLLQRLGLSDDKLKDQDEGKLDEALADALSSSQLATSSDPGTKGDPSQSSDPLNSDAAKSGNPSDSSKSDPNPASKPGANGSKPQEKSVLSKMMDAMDNLFSDDDSDDNQDSQPQNAKAQQNPKAAAQKDKTPLHDDPKGDKTGEGQGGEGQGEQQQNDDNQGQDPTASASAQKQSGPNAAGSEEGSKSVKAAKQLAAMGKISELIGKRSLKVTGQSMIDAQSGDQKLKTAYTQESATHGVGAGDVSRDQIPLSEQAYIEQYFEQVRKTDSAAKPVKSKQ